MTINNCELCGEPMPEGEEMFKYHGLSGPCPKPTKGGAPFTQEDIIELIRTKYDPEPNDWPRHRGWDDGTKEIAAEIMAKFDAAIEAIKRA